MEEAFIRSAMLLGEDAIEKLKSSRVLLFGVGGVGSAAAESLARSGVGTVGLCDNDVVSPSNLNRQLVALHSTLGQPKTSVAAGRMRDINPAIRIIEYPFFYGKDTAERIPLEEYDGNKLYITLDYRTMYLDENNNKIEYHGEKLVVAALYTSNPRAI